VIPIDVAAVSNRRLFGAQKAPLQVPPSLYLIMVINAGSTDIGNSAATSNIDQEVEKLRTAVRYAPTR
jgi:hypothetical protein